MFGGGGGSFPYWDSNSGPPSRGLVTNDHAILAVTLHEDQIKFYPVANSELVHIVYIYIYIYIIYLLATFFGLVCI
jgi:hypothetical protein